MTLKTKWKQLKYWQKGGVIGFILGFAWVWLILIFASLTSSTWTCDYLIQRDTCDFNEFILSIFHWGGSLVYGAIGFLIFSVIGWVYGEAKNRK